MGGDGLNSLGDDRTVDQLTGYLSGAGFTSEDIQDIFDSCLSGGEGRPKQPGNERSVLMELSGIVEKLLSAYTPEGVGIWLRARNLNLGGESPIELLAGGYVEKVVAESERIAGAM